VSITCKILIKHQQGQLASFLSHVAQLLDRIIDMEKANGREEKQFSTMSLNGGVSQEERNRNH
jgi:ACT domain-containing protein